MNSYEAKQERRRERYEELAEKNRQKSTEEFKKADLSEDATGIPFGQPILVGHHSEGRHRRTLERADNAMRRSIEADKKADYYASKAAGVGTGGISSDDPQAIDKLREKLAGLEQSQESMKTANKIIRNKRLEDIEVLAELQEIGLSEANAKLLIEPDFCGRIGFASYQLQNNNANIRRIKERIAKLETAPKETTEEQIGDVTIVTNTEENRIQVFFPDKPPEEIRKILKSHGFRWSRYQGAWQRHISNQAKYWAEIVAKAYCDWQRPCGETE